MTAGGQQLAAQLLAAGLRATLDPREVAGRAPCVHVTPPVVDYRQRTVRWQLLAVAGVVDALLAWQQLDQLVDDVAAVLHVELAEPVSWAASPTDDPVPAYRLTVTTSS